MSPRAQRHTASRAPASRDNGSDSPDLNLVGIGASAGGIAALRAFFQNVPADAGLVFVVVIHLSPDYDSNLAEVLQPSVRMPVQKVEGRMRMEPNHVYVIPQNRSLSVTDGFVEAAEFANDRQRRAAIDFFFRTLAAAHADSVGVLLSGSGSDGALGMRAIKEKGGVILAQSPDDAEYAEMPRSIIASGLVDFVLPARQLGEKVVDLRPLSEPWPLRAREDEVAERDSEDLGRIMAQLKARTGHDLSGYKRSTVLRRIGRRMRVAQVHELSAYAALMQRDGAEPNALLKDLLISVTSFFRDPKVFEVIERTVVPSLLAATPAGESLRVWVPGCATGEEVYSLAMLLQEQANALSVPPAVQIFASDLDEDAIASAREGLFPAAVAADVGEERLERFFRSQGAYFRVRKELRDIILFTTHNLLRDPPFSHVDLISCRNLLIYLDRDLQRRVYDLFHCALRDEGILVLGSAESIDESSLHFRQLDHTHRIYQRRPDPRPAALRFPDLPLSLGPRRATRLDRGPFGGGDAASSELERHRAALERHAPPSILVDEHHAIVHVSPTATRYLQYPSGSPTANLLRSARAELRAELRSALFQALERKRSCQSEPVPLAIEGEARLVQLHAAPVDGPLALVVFLESDPPAAAARTAEASGAARHQGQVEEEFGALRERLRHTVEEAETHEEELKAANEELQSMNEEYRSTLEELETSREELQSMNEELKTVNEELKGKVDELARSNDDLLNLMTATDIGTLFLDRQLRIQRFTPALRRIFNVMSVDVGRPLSDLTHRLNYPAFRDDCMRVLYTLQPVEREGDTADGAAFLVRVTPYRTGEDRIAGVVATFTDITVVRQAQEQLRRSEERCRLLLDGVHEYAMFMTDADGRITMWNPGAERIFQFRESHVLGHSGAVIFTPEDRAAGVPEMEITTARREGQAADERWHVRRDGTRFWASGTLTAVRDPAGTLHGFAKVLRDNTARRQQEEALRESEATLRTLAETLETRVAERTAELATAHDRLHGLASEIVLAEQRVRRDIARRLHDELQQHLYGVHMRVAALRRQYESDADEALRTPLDDVARWLGEAVLLTRRLAIDLSPPVLSSDDLVESLDWLGNQMRELHGLRVEVRGDAVGTVESEDLRVLIFQSVRELLFNVVKHADAPRASIDVRRTQGEIIVQVSDGGPGFNAEEVLSTGMRAGFGLASVLERLRLFGGDVRIESVPGRGTTITVIAPERAL